MKKNLWGVFLAAMVGALVGITVWSAPNEDASILPWSLVQEALRWQVMGPGVDVPCEALLFILEEPAEDYHIEFLIGAGYAVGGVSGAYVTVLAPITLYIDQERGADALGFVRTTLPHLGNWHNLEWGGWSDDQLAACVATSSAASKDSGDHSTSDDAVTLLDEAASAYSEARFWDAIALYEEALVIVRRLGEQQSEGEVLHYLGKCHHALGDYSRAITNYEESLAVKREIGDRAGEAKSLNNLGLCYYALSTPPWAIAYLEESLAIAREIGDRIGEARSLYNLSFCYESLSDYPQAIAYAKEALAIQRVIGDRAGEAKSLCHLGVCYITLSDYPQAIAHLETSQAIAREIGDRAGEAGSLNNLGICYWSLSDYRRAIAYHEESLTIAREIGDRAGEANSLNSLGSCYWGLSEYQRAIDYFEKSVVFRRRLGDRAGEAKALNNLGACYFALFDYRRAIAYYEESLVVKREIGDRAGEAASLNNLGACHWGLSEYQRALDYYEESLRVFREAGDRFREAMSLGNLGLCYESLFDYRRAMAYYEESLVIFLEIGDHAGEAKSLCNLGDCYEALSDYQRAIAHYEQALALAVELETRETERLVHSGLGRTYRAMEDPEMALMHYEAAIAIVESIRGAVGDEELRQSYFGGLRRLYEEYLELLLETGRSEETIFVAERLRARTFLDGLYQAGLAPEQLLLDEAGIVSSADETVPVVDAAMLDHAVEEAKRFLLPNEAALEYMVGDDGVYLWVLTTDRTLGPQFIPYERERLLRDVVALRRAIEPQTKEVDGVPELFFTDPTEALRVFYGALLRPAMDQLNDVIDTLIFIPSGPLWYVPFAALAMTDRPEIEVTDPAGFVTEYRPPYLIEEYTLGFLPSVASLPMLLEGEGASTTGSYLALANPTLSEEQQAAVGPHYQHGVLETACRAFAAYVGGEEADVHVRTDAREALAYDLSAGQRVLMYACHGDFNPSVPLASRLLLAPGEEAAFPLADRRLPDGDYHASEVLLTDHEGVDLVVLAACETLLPTLREIEGVLGMTLGPEADERLSLEQLELIVAGDEVVGLSRSFLSSGAHSVLATLWQASPSAIEKLLVSLGEHAQQGMTWSQALCQAQRGLLGDETFAHVWFWAPYQLIGRWR